MLLFFVVRAEVFHGPPRHTGASSLSAWLNQAGLHRTSIQPFFFVPAKKLCGSSLHRPLVLNTNGQL